MPELPEGVKVRFNDKEFNFSTAITGRELMKGLGGVEALAEYDGMLFDFGVKHNIVMWSKGLLFPVEVAFLDDGGEIKGFGRLDPEDHPSFTLSIAEPTRYALEVPVGFFAEHDIKIGDKFSL